MLLRYVTCSKKITIFARWIQKVKRSAYLLPKSSNWLGEMFKNEARLNVRSLRRATHRAYRSFRSIKKTFVVKRVKHSTPRMPITTNELTNCVVSKPYDWHLRLWSSNQLSLSQHFGTLVPILASHEFQMYFWSHTYRTRSNVVPSSIQNELIHFAGFRGVAIAIPESNLATTTENIAHELKIIKFCKYAHFDEFRTIRRERERNCKMKIYNW